MYMFVQKLIRNLSGSLAVHVRQVKDSLTSTLTPNSDKEMNYPPIALSNRQRTRTNELYTEYCLYIALNVYD